MTANPLTLSKKEANTTPTTEDKEYFVAKYVVLPGALGGLTKIVMEVKETTEDLQVIQSAPAQPEINLAALGYLVPSSLFLGVISSFIGMFVLSDFLDLKKSKLKVFGLSLLFGLFFPLVFDAASNTLQLQTEIEILEEEKVQVEEIAINNAMPVANDSLSLETAIQDIEALAVGTNDVRNQEMAIQNIEELAQSSPSLTVSQEALTAIASIAQQSQQERGVTEAIRAIEKVALHSNQLEVRELAVEILENLREQVLLREESLIDEAVSRILSQP